jgi:hypothetical protein
MPRAPRLFPTILSCALAAAAGALMPAAASASGNQEAIFQDDTFVKANPALALQTFQELGVQRVRVFFTWASIAPSPSSATKPKGFDATDPASYPAAGWSTYDAIVRDARADGLKLDVTLTSPAPIWATGAAGRPRSGAPRTSWMPSDHEFQSFVHAVGTRYSGNYTPAGQSSPLPAVSYWAIWNEVNYGQYLSPQTTAAGVELAPALYRGLLNAANAGLSSSGHGSDTIVIGETAPRGQGGGVAGGVKPMRFIRALYCVDSGYRELRGAAAAARGCPANGAGSAQFRSQNPLLFNATAFAVHPYSQGLPPSLSTTGLDKIGFDPDVIDFQGIPRAEQALDRVYRSYGSHRHIPIVSTEYAYVNGSPISLPQATAAFYMNWAEYLSWKQPRLWSYAQYLFIDPPVGKAYSTFYSGLETANGQHKQSFAAYRMPIYLPVTSAKKGASLELWGGIRPSVNYGSATAEIQFQAPGGQFSTVATVTKTNSVGYFDTHVSFPGSGNVRLAWSYPSGPLSGATIYSRVVVLAEK